MGTRQSFKRLPNCWGLCRGDRRAAGRGTLVFVAQGTCARRFLQGREEAAKVVCVAPSKECDSFRVLGFNSALEVLLLCEVDCALLPSLEHSEAPAASLAFAQLKVRRGQLPSSADRDKASLRVTSPSW